MHLALLLSTMVGCFVGSLVPVINTELIVLAAAAAAPPELAGVLVLIASATQMAAKSILYLAGAGLLHLPRGRMAERLERALASAEAHQGASGTLLFTSASTGFPPFYVISVASGALRLDFWRFLLLGFLGRTVRFGVVVALPQLVKTLF